MDKILQIFRELGPGDGVGDISLAAEHVLFHGLIERPHGGSFAENFKSDPLPDVPLGAPIFDQGLSRPAQHVDEAGCHGQALGIDLKLTAPIDDRPHRGDRVAVNRKVSPIGCGTTAVINDTVSNDQVVFQGSGAGSQQGPTHQGDSETNHGFSFQA